MRCADALERAIDELGPGRVAAVIAEPVAILQAVKVPHDGYWERVQAICKDAGALLIVDEVVTGFGRTGRMFGAEHWDVRPDILTMAKGITSGYVPLGAVAVSRAVEEAFSEPLLHLNTYAGHPVACEAALANIEILRPRAPSRARGRARADPAPRARRACRREPARHPHVGDRPPQQHRAERGGQRRRRRRARPPRDV